MTRIETTPLRVASLRKHLHQHKYDHGHLLVISGPAYQTGAARLAAYAGLRIGAGLVTMGGAASALPVLAVHLTEIMLHQIDDGTALQRLLRDDQRYNALCIGPGLGLDSRAEDLVAAALSSQRPMVVDADALTLIGRSESLAGLLHSNVVATPHMGEFLRLFPNIDPKQVTDMPVRAVQEAADLLGCTVLLKGPVTYVCAPRERASILDNKRIKPASWLATAGSGDVLAGLVGGLLARGLQVTDAAETAALVHVLAGKRFGPGLIAGDLPDQVPYVLQDLGV